MMDMVRISQITNGRQFGSNSIIRGLVNDTRKDCVDKLYVAIAGPNFDGHQFIEKAKQNGANGALIEQDSSFEVPAVKVGNSVEAMGQIAAAWREDFDIPVLGITGSAGKTTLKEMAGSILSISRSGIITEGNLNNQIGVPLTLTRISSDDEFAVIEMGMSNKGEIAYLSDMVKPTVAIINNAAPAHLDDLGSVEAVARAKGEIVEGLASDGVLIINADDQYCSLWQSLAGSKRVITFGLNVDADISAQYVPSATGSEITVGGEYGEFSVSLNLPGKHNVRNALAVIAATLEMGCSLADVRQGLSIYQPLSNRGGTHQFPELMLVDDTYNANPVSMLAAFDVLSLQADQFRENDRSVKVILVLGDMGELGQRAEELHQHVGQGANDVADVLYCCGQFQAQYQQGFVGKADNHVNFEAMMEALLFDIESAISQNVFPLVLVKGSRMSGMERVVEAIIAHEHKKNNKLGEQ